MLKWDSIHHELYPITPTSTPPTSSMPISIIHQSNLVQSALPPLTQNNPPHLPISSLLCTNGINDVNGPTSSEIASLFGNLIPPMVNSL
ncbi:hypothetical protein O181_121885 [Austropuccinia psidii MF-1]|uniref:Uncharacterized protein n=1 Tax=Austropuccinia psidii MF-1 TaxID=1389203 RepID=A0A9Q3Q2Q6_9BASI|nr:hypothetical protein [Austropuccinia psidii MF-1]